MNEDATQEPAQPRGEAEGQEPKAKTGMPRETATPATLSLIHI